MTDWYYGSDTNSGKTTCASHGGSSPFYIGRLGGEVTAGGGGFNTATASAIGNYDLVSGYWDVAGPLSTACPPGTSPTDWGSLQAAAFIRAAELNPQVLGTTFFGDVEANNLGWSTQVNNQETISGFLSYLGNSGVTPGLYANHSDWDTYLGESWHSSYPFVWWLADSYEAITTCADASTQWESLIAPGGLDRGGYKVMIWQYNDHPPSASDLNITPYSGYLSGHWNATPV
jgi:hypothetical protein